MSTTKEGMMLVQLIKIAEVPGGRERNFQLYVRVPEGVVEALPLRVTVLPTAAVWFGPGFAMGPAGVVWYVHAIWVTARLAELARTMKVLLLATWLLAGTGAKFRLLDWPSTRKL